MKLGTPGFRMCQSALRKLAMIEHDHLEVCIRQHRVCIQHSDRQLHLNIFKAK